MPRTLRRLWADDTAAVISSELVLVLGILVFGLIPGFVALRNSGIAALTNLANIVAVIFPKVTFSEVNPGVPASGYVVLVNPITNATPLTTVQVQPRVAPVSPGAPAP
jgi:hypothetical protein